MAKAGIGGNTENITAAITVSRYYYLLRILFPYVLSAYFINHGFTSFWHFMISGDWNAKWLQRGPYFVSTVSRNNFNEWITSMEEHFWRGKKSALASIQLRVRKNSTAWHQDDWNLTYEGPHSTRTVLLTLFCSRRSWSSNQCKGWQFSLLHPVETYLRQ